MAHMVASRKSPNDSPWETLSLRLSRPISAPLLILGTCGVPAHSWQLLSHGETKKKKSRDKDNERKAIPFWPVVTFPTYARFICRHSLPEFHNQWNPSGFGKYQNNSYTIIFLTFQWFNRFRNLTVNMLVILLISSSCWKHLLFGRSPPLLNALLTIIHLIHTTYALFTLREVWRRFFTPSGVRSEVDWVQFASDLTSDLGSKAPFHSRAIPDYFGANQCAEPVFPETATIICP